MSAPYKYSMVVNGVDIPLHTVTWVAFWYTPRAGVLGQKPRHLYSRESCERRVILRTWLVNVLNFRKLLKEAWQHKYQRINSCLAVSYHSLEELRSCDH